MAYNLLNIAKGIVNVESTLTATREVCEVAENIYETITRVMGIPLTKSWIVELDKDYARINGIPDSINSTRETQSFSEVLDELRSIEEIDPKQAGVRKIVFYCVADGNRHVYIEYEYGRPGITICDRGICPESNKMFTRLERPEIMSLTKELDRNIGEYYCDLPGRIRLERKLTKFTGIACDAMNNFDWYTDATYVTDTHFIDRLNPMYYAGFGKFEALKSSGMIKFYINLSKYLKAFETGTIEEKIKDMILDMEPDRDVRAQYYYLADFIDVAVGEERKSLTGFRYGFQADMEKLVAEWTILFMWSAARLYNLVKEVDYPISTSGCTITIIDNDALVEIL